MRTPDRAELDRRRRAHDSVQKEFQHCNHKGNKTNDGKFLRCGRCNVVLGKL